jgi:dimethylaniline monooxygenase (N-oxide forming)
MREIHTSVTVGWYGLVAARTYLRLEPDTNLLIIDNDSTVGGVWSKDRLYPNLVAQVKRGLFNYTDTPMPKDGKTDNDMVTGSMIHNYLQKYAEDHDLLSRIRFNTFVERVERCPHGWRLHFKDSEEQIETKKLMVATGVTSIPRMPELDRNDESVPIIHSRDLGSCWQALDSDKIQEVVVLGAAKSAYDAVYLLLKMRKKVTWVIRPHGAGPLAILPSEILGLFNSIAVASTRMMTYLSPSILNSQGYLSYFFHRNWLGRGLTNAFWNSLNYISATHAGYTAKDHVARLKPEINGKRLAKLNLRSLHTNRWQ